LLPVRCAFRHDEREAVDRDSDCATLLQRDARARPNEPEILSRAGAVARYAFDGFLRLESHIDLHRRSGVSLAVHHVPLRVSRFGIALALAFATSPRRTCLGCGRAGDEPRDALRSSTEPTTSSQRAVLRRPAAPSWRATWAEVCEQLPVGSAKVPCALLLKGVVRSGIPSSRDPEHPLSSARVRERLECHSRLGWLPPGRPRSSFASPPAKEETFPKTRVLGTAP